MGSRSSEVREIKSAEKSLPQQRRRKMRRRKRWWAVVEMAGQGSHYSPVTRRRVPASAGESPASRRAVYVLSWRCSHV